MKKTLSTLAAVAVFAIATAGHGQTTVKRSYGPAAQKFANAIWAGDTLYVAGQMASPKTPADKATGTPAAYGNTEDQTESALKNIETVLKREGLTMADVVQMDVFMAADPATGKMDFAGMNAAYSKFFGTAEQPNKPVRSAMQVAGLATPWGLVEIQVVAVKSK